MPYPIIPDLQYLIEQITLYSQLQHEYGTGGIASVLEQVEGTLTTAIETLRALPIDQQLAAREPNELTRIRELRPDGPRRLWKAYNDIEYRNRLEGALLGRFVGCTLGAPVEFWPIEKMAALAQENGDPFPPTNYWSYIPEPLTLRYQMSPREAYTRNNMDGVPVDDDIAYTLLGLLVVEEFGPDFSIEENGKAWLKYLPYACTAEDVALKNLKAGIPAHEVGATENPYCEWIGADIRADPWGYMAPGWPERAADMAYRDAYLSHRRQGIYGEMFFAATIAAAFAVDDPIEALKIGVTEIPSQCALATAIHWALNEAPRIHNYRQAREAVEERFKGMHPVHTINNACLTVFGITIGGRGFTKVIGETVAMGMDNDCTAATAGSIVGAVIGKEGIPEHWYTPFNDMVHSYLLGEPHFAITDLTERFEKQAKLVHRSEEIQ
jgi:ADP-ribosylglycohydrolase